MENKRALSKNQFMTSKFDSSGYHFMEKEGTFEGVLKCKMWGKSQNLLAFIQLNGGEKIICSAWQKTNYMGLTDILVGTKINVSFEKSSNGRLYLRAAEALEE